MIQQIIIKPLIGIEGLPLGIEMSDVIDILGEPDERSTREYEADGSIDKIWEYCDIGLTLTFSSDDDWKLGNITVESPNAELKGCRLIGLDEDEFLQEFQQAKLGSIKLDDDFTELGSRDYVCNELELSFWIQDGKLDSITIFPQWDESGNIPLWPKDKDFHSDEDV